jgi:hypothetical protein
MQTAFERLLKMMRAGAALSLHRQDAHGFACCYPAR